VLHNPFSETYQDIRYGGALSEFRWLSCRHPPRNSAPMIDMELGGTAIADYGRERESEWVRTMN